ncbi:MAG: SurA N-terminal domain-containing protein [Candidatus Paceibacterota bacterium]
MTEETNESRTISQKNNVLPAIVGIIAVLALLAGGYYLLGMQTPAENGSNETSDLLDLEGEGPVARVNGAEISREEYRRGVEQIVASYAAQGTTIPDEEVEAVKEQILNNLINRQLVLQAATEAGTQATEEEIEAEFQNMIANFNDSDSLNAALTEAGITEQELRADIETSIIIDKYLSSRVDTESLTVTDEEVSAYYETASQEAGSTEIPPLEEVADLIRNQLLAEKQQQALAVELERLRASANIEILI